MFTLNVTLNPMTPLYSWIFLLPSSFLIWYKATIAVSLVSFFFSSLKSTLRFSISRMKSHFQPNVRISIFANVQTSLLIRVFVTGAETWANYTRTRLDPHRRKSSTDHTIFTMKTIGLAVLHVLYEVITDIFHLIIAAWWWWWCPTRPRGTLTFPCLACCSNKAKDKYKVEIMSHHVCCMFSFVYVDYSILISILH